MDSGQLPIHVPASFEHVDIHHLTELIADMIVRLIAHNDRIPLHPDALTRFHSRSPPSISVHDYLARIVKYAKVDRSCLLITLHYIDQICTRLPKFTITSLTVHRFIIASVTVSSKALCDVFCTNSHYATVGGIKTDELNVLEREFLSIIDWRLFCTQELLQSYYVNLVRTHSRALFTLDAEHESIEASVEQSDTDIDELGSLEDPDEAESTAPPPSCAASTAESEGICSEYSDSGDDEVEEPMPAFHSPNITTPRPKRGADHLSDIALDVDDQRPRGRRRLSPEES
ncbi:hypothetical protein FRB99_000837 [Tulasnella sp. 403]|nr:hypothetical protein FRB99_000837 [Tulasnella sp. 403]